jgi:hypothetical protein
MCSPGTRSGGPGPTNEATTEMTPTNQTADVAPNAAADPVLVQRAKVARWVSLGQRVGYGLYGLACAVFAWTVIDRPTQWAVNVMVVALIVGSVVLLPAIIFGYAVKAAERHDRALAAEAARKKAERVAAASSSAVGSADPGHPSA